VEPDRDAAGAGAVRVAAHAVRRSELDAVVADERQRIRTLAQELEDPARMVLGTGREVLVSEAQVPLPPPPEELDDRVPGVPDERYRGRPGLQHRLLLPRPGCRPGIAHEVEDVELDPRHGLEDRKSTRLNSSHS